MIPDRVKIWTTRGYQNVNEITSGDRVISYNANRGCMEYDQIGYVQTEWLQQGVIGLKQASVNVRMTLDHPLLIINPYTKEISRIEADELFMKRGGKYKRVLTNKPFEPYQQNQDLEDVEWAARIAASSSRFRMAPLYSDALEAVLKDITAIEAQAWLTTFFHWNVLRSRPIYMKTCLLRSEAVKAMLYHVAPRAGVGTFYGAFKTRAHHTKWTQAFSIAKEGDTQIQREHWCADRHEGIFYNISTKNGNALVKFGSSTFPIACDYS